jgi:hypothetical protein
MGNYEFRLLHSIVLSIRYKVFMPTYIGSLLQRLDVMFCQSALAFGNKLGR